MNYEALRYVIEQAPVTGAAWQVLTVIAYRADRRTGECTANQRTLAQEARVARSSAQVVLSELVGRGIVEIVIDGSGRRATCYRIVGHLHKPEARPSVQEKPLEDRQEVHYQRPDHKSTTPVDNSVVDRQVTGSGPIVNPVVDRWSARPIGRREKRREDLEGQPPVVTQEPSAAALAPDGAAAEQQGSIRSEWRAVLNPNPNGRSPPEPS